MAATGNYELLCLENPLLDIQGVGYVQLTPTLQASVELRRVKYPHQQANRRTVTRSFSRSTASRPTMPSSLTPRSTWVCTMI
jgi:hypothetical protein